MYAQGAREKGLVVLVWWDDDHPARPQETTQNLTLRQPEEIYAVR